MFKLLNSFNKKFQTSSLKTKLDIEVRPNASNGIWLFFLLPVALIISALKHHIVLTETYKSVVIFSVGIVFTNIFIIRAFLREKYVRIHQLWVIIPISVLFIYFKKGEVLFAFYSGFFCTIIYSRVYLMVLKLLPRSFTLGEASLTAQAATMILYTTLPHFYHSIENPVILTGASSTVIIQMELFGIMILGGFLYHFKIKHIAVYFWSFLILLLTFLIPLHVFLRRSPILWVLSLLVEDLPTIRMILYWIICVCLATLAVIKQRNKASTSERKIFHVLAVAVYVPGLMYECNLLYLGSGILLGIFFLLEILRILKVPPLGEFLQQGFMALSDEKDAGILAVTPIYLLTGFTSPIWLHPAPCDVTDSAYFSLLPLLSGILSVGIGDTVASMVGSNYGKHFYHGEKTFWQMLTSCWVDGAVVYLLLTSAILPIGLIYFILRSTFFISDSKKTVEGTLASIISQLLMIYLLYQIGFIGIMDGFHIVQVTVAVVITSIIEAKTDQIDNAILPFVMYIMLI